MSTFELREDFYLNGKPFQIISGALHYFRVHPAYWRDRLQKLRAMGCNTVETYIPWNFHERVEGVFDFSGWRDVCGFVRMAQEEGLYVMLRPSPYICAEWEFGGLPAWLLAKPGLRLRCSEEQYLQCVMRYYDQLLPRLAPLEIGRGGPVILMQVENEYGSYGDDKAYLAALVNGMRARGVTVPLITSDGPEEDMLAAGHAEGALSTANFGSDADGRFGVLRSLSIRPLMCTEFWIGWFDHFGCGAHHRTDANACARELARLLAMGHVNIYMFHGGTSFGLMNGANDYESLMPDVTSYDYDAPLAEDGRETEKYRLFQQTIFEHLGKPVPARAAKQIARRAYGAAVLTAQGSLWSRLRDMTPAARAPVPLCMEALSQDTGYVLYRTTFERALTLEKLRLVGAADRAQVFVDGKCVLTLYDRQLCQEHIFQAPIPLRVGTELCILVENLGRVNFGWKIENQRKGIGESVLINGKQRYGWEMFRLDERALLALAPEDDPADAPLPRTHRLTFTVDTPCDTFLALPGFGKGVCFLNGFTLGRFWEIGPQKRLYIPAPLLKTGKNELVLFETDAPEGFDALHDEKARLYDEPDIG